MCGRMREKERREREIERFVKAFWAAIFKSGNFISCKCTSKMTKKDYSS